MKKIKMLILAFAVALSSSAQNEVDNQVAKLVKSYPKTPSRELIDKDPKSGKVLQQINNYIFEDIKKNKLTSLISAMRNPQNGYYLHESKMEGNECIYELRVAAPDPDYRTVYILQTNENNTSLHILYGKVPFSEMTTNFSYSTKKYYNIINKSTNAKLGNSFDYNIHASTYINEVPAGRGPNGIVVSQKKVFQFKLIPTVVVDTRFTDAISQDCFIVTEDLLALEDGSDTSEGQWLMFRYLDKNKLCQQWRIIKKDGVVTIINKGTGRCMDLAGGDSKEGAAVFSYEINEDTQTNSNQKWMIVEAEQ